MARMALESQVTYSLGTLAESVAAATTGKAAELRAAA
jgi:hypothetical protein